MKYCGNDLCDSEAIYYIRTPKGQILPLCAHCASAFELGQMYPKANLDPIEDLPEEEHEDD